jgi:alpha-tubulin suppressor-like RCC1 family protein
MWQRSHTHLTVKCKLCDIYRKEHISMKYVAHETAWGFTRWLWFAIGLTLAAGCSSGISSDLAGDSGGGGGNGGFGGRSNSDAVVEEGERAILPGSLDEVLVVGPTPTATACTTGAQCPTGTCSDGFCCDQKCDNKCMACSAAKKGGGLDGVCGSIAYDTDPDNDCPYGACDGKNQCKNYNGFSCTSTAQCLSNYCVDGVCCGNICMGSCSACSAAKKGSGSDGVCGFIKAGVDIDSECNPGECNGGGACNASPQPTAPNGSACASSAMCQSGFCADGVCCDSWCLGTCQACTAAKKGGGVNGVCGSIANDQDPDDECWGGACNGAGVCKQYNGVPCTNKSQCLSGYCIDGVCCGNVCTGWCYACSESKKGQGYDGVCGPITFGRDVDNECSPGECNGGGACSQAQTPLTNGTVCVAGAQCASGNCVDGVCCENACLGTCYACTAALKGQGVDGICGVIGSERDPDGECNGGKCDGTGACRYYNGAACSATNQCFSNYCVDGFCCGNVCSGPCQACSASKKGGAGADGVCGQIPASYDPDNECNPGACNGASGCTQPQAQLANGSACTFATQCTAGWCVDGVCCNAPCATSCVACTAAKTGQPNGTCAYVPNLTDPDNECANGDCNGGGACVASSNLPNGSSCGTASQCLSGQCVDGVCCNVACTGSCVACTTAKQGQGTNGICGPIKYDFDPEEECVNGACNGIGACQFYNSVPCTQATQCLSSYCVDNVCCGNNCGGTCYACTAAKKGNGSDGVCGFIKNNADPDNECAGTNVCNGAGVCAVGTCSTNADCAANATCANTTCTCNSGYTGDGFTSCTDVDECQISNGGCSANATCTNTPGSRTCACNAGYTGDGITCTDIDECLTIVAGYAATCAQSNDNRFKCWGYNISGKLGLGDTNKRGDNPNEMGTNLPFLNLGTGRLATQLSMGGVHACAVLDNSTLKCWGDNFSGELGLGDQTNRGDNPNEMGDNLPTINLGTGKTPIQVAAAIADYSCALLNDGSVKCWGSANVGQLGQGDTTVRGDNPNEMGDNLPPIQLGTGRTATAISLGQNHACAILDNGSVKCWGSSSAGQCGWGDTSTRGDNAGEMGDNLPVVDVGTGKTVTAIAAGVSHTCALLNDGSIKCWGGNAHGELGLGDTVSRGVNPGEMGDNLPAVSLGTGKTAVAIAASYYHSCALLNDATVKCWGWNVDGQLGQGDTSSRGNLPGQMGDNLLPINLGTGKTVVAMSSRDQHSCAILNDGKLKCWGLNFDGQLGLGDTITRGNAGGMGDPLIYVLPF